MSPEWSVYIVRTGKGTLYTGITTDVARRLAEHESGTKGARSLRGKGPLKLVFQAEAGDRSRASRLEWHIKQWPKARKEALVRGELTLPDDV
ncbi:MULTISPECIES: GIY-YIG nuclease family protein [Marinobacter]|uniref:GIY-YIG nuclease family protein n=1 Tax=Marinobacter suaedae TaxID=3057675 RepID=A0ABT8VWY8_9GAMM|nr:MULTISPECIES: GIY-YIG nuclease family protein [unclassified Marinobacter]MBZ2168579.1 GIY-YIG nuclease family protein [Marinobacter sp. F4216]MDO3720476.1 GIY-YIG nuclease family protein [Marinobacter sp. chi1]